MCATPDSLSAETGPGGARVGEPGPELYRPVKVGARRQTGHSQEFLTYS